jgi:hypothetical protein
MSTIRTIRHATVVPYNKYIEREWVGYKNDKVSFAERTICQRHIKSRFGHLALIPVSLCADIMDTVRGIFPALGTFLTLGTNRGLSKSTMDDWKGLDNLLADPYLHFIKAINPKADVGYKSGKYNSGILAEIAQKKIIKWFYNCQCSDSFIKKQIGTRLTMALWAVTMIITRVVDGVLGVVAAVFSILTLGSSPCGWKFNVWAHKGLHVTAIVSDLFKATIGFINPSVFLELVSSTIVSLLMVK